MRPRSRSVAGLEVHCVNLLYVLAGKPDGAGGIVGLHSDERDAGGALLGVALVDGRTALGHSAPEALCATPHLLFRATEQDVVDPDVHQRGCAALRLAEDGVAREGRGSDLHQLRCSADAHWQAREPIHVAVLIHECKQRRRRKAHLVETCLQIEAGAARLQHTREIVAVVPNVDARV